MGRGFGTTEREVGLFFPKWNIYDEEGLLEKAAVAESASSYRRVNRL